MNARFGGDKVIVEIQGERKNFDSQQLQEIEKMCREEILSNILESTLIDTNVKIAFMICRQVGWPVDFQFENYKTKFRMIVPCSSADTGDQIVKKLE